MEKFGENSDNKSTISFFFVGLHSLTSCDSKVVLPVTYVNSFTVLRQKRNFKHEK